MKKKALSIIAAVLLASISLTACGAGGSKSSESSNPGASASTDMTSTAETNSAPKEITMLMFTDWYKPGIQAVEKDINDNADKLGFKLNIEKIAGGQQGEDLYRARAAANELPMLIAHYGISTGLKDLGGFERFQEVGGDWTKDIPEAIMESYIDSESGKVYGIPFDSINVSGVFYNKKVYEKLNLSVPKTYAEFLANCEKIKAAGITPIYLSAKDTWTVNLFDGEGWHMEKESQPEFVAKLNNNKAHFTDYTGFKNAIQKQKELLDKGYFQKSYLADGYDGAHKALVDGTAAMVVNATWMMDEIKAKFPDQASDIGAFRVPFDDNNKVSIFTPFTLSATDKFEDKELLKKFIDYFTSQAAQQKFFDAQGGISYQKGVTSSLLPAQADLKAYVDQGGGSNYWAINLKYDAVSDSNNYILDYFTGGKTLDEVITAMDTVFAKSAKAKGDPNWK
ncbi:ABC transporter substrate-binding protein [Cohnella sp.]|uniref:ABC transporter substrate-binding protein n=1 Tax=Cohnella sp. TaxID=1883426 RepID=UPI003561E65A